MNVHRILGPAGLLPAILLMTSPGGGAQQRDPHIGYVFPAGGQKGTTIEVTVAGQFLNGAGEVFLSGKGLQARVVKYYKPPAKSRTSGRVPRCTTTS